VTATADGDKQIVFAREIYAADYVSDVRAPRDQTRLLVNHRIVNLASFIIIGVARLDKSASQASFEFGDGIFVKHTRTI
jgi:hypothetical protein